MNYDPRTIGDPLNHAHFTREGRTEIMELICGSPEFRDFFSKTGIHLKDMTISVKLAMDLIDMIEELNRANDRLLKWNRMHESFLDFLSSITPFAALKRYRETLDEEKSVLITQRKQARDSPMQLILTEYNREKGSAATDIVFPDIISISHTNYNDPNEESSSSSSIVTVD